MAANRSPVVHLRQSAFMSLSEVIDLIRFAFGPIFLSAVSTGRSEANLCVTPEMAGVVPSVRSNSLLSGKSRQLLCAQLHGCLAVVMGFATPLARRRVMPCSIPA